MTKKRNGRNGSLGCGGSLLVLAAAIVSLPVNAQKVAPAESASGLAADGDIIVTAQRRETRLLDTPQSVAVLTGDELARMGVTQLRDFADTVPGLNINTTGAGFTQVSLRGVTTGVDVASSVAFYIDDVPFGPSSVLSNANRLTLDAGLFDVDRVEVLRGPQGTLYGASSLGGLIKYVGTTPDTRQLGGQMRAGISDTRSGGLSYFGNATINIPLAAERAGLRASGYYSRDGGYVDNAALGEKDVNRSKIFGGRADLLLQPAERLSIRLSGFVQDIRRDGQATADYNYDGRRRLGDLEQGRLLREPFDQRFRLVSGTLDYDMDWADLKSITSYQTVWSDTTYDLSPFWVPFARDFLGAQYSAVGYSNTVNAKKLTQEVRLSSPNGRPLEWVVGAFYNHEKSVFDGGFDLRGPTGAQVPNNLSFQTDRLRLNEYAGFANARWYLSDRFDVSGGIRVSRNEQRADFDSGGAFGSGARRVRTSESITTYLADARYHFSSRTMAYARFATGYRPGGPNSVANDPITGQPLGPTSFDSDTLKSYEAGLKGQTEDRSFTWDLSAYHIDWSNIQILGVRNGFGVTANAAGGARINGFEGAFSVRPTRGFDVGISFAIIDAELRKADVDLGSAAGESLPGVPRYTATLTADYVLLDSAAKPSIGATLRFLSKRTAGFDNSASYPQYDLPSYAALDLRAGATFDPVVIQLYVRNLLDTRGQLPTFNWNRLYAQPGIIQPRTIGLSASVSF